MTLFHRQINCGLRLPCSLFFVVIVITNNHSFELEVGVVSHQLSHDQVMATLDSEMKCGLQIRVLCVDQARAVDKQFLHVSRASRAPARRPDVVRSSSPTSLLPSTIQLLLIHRPLCVTQNHTSLIEVVVELTR